MAKTSKSHRSETTPNAQQIAVECRRIRASWNPRQRQRRALRGVVHVQLIYGLLSQ
jgi:hypothetical protein